MPSSDTTAPLSYLIATGERPIYIASRGGADAALSIGAEFELREVDIRDARELNPPASLDTEGFTLREHKTAVTDFYNLESEQTLYEAEITELVLTATAATDVFVFDHTLRSDSSMVLLPRNDHYGSAIDQDLRLVPRRSGYPYYPQCLS